MDIKTYDDFLSIDECNELINFYKNKEALINYTSDGIAKSINFLTHYSNEVYNDSLPIYRVIDKLKKLYPGIYVGAIALKQNLYPYNMHVDAHNDNDPKLSNLKSYVNFFIPLRWNTTDVPKTYFFNSPPVTGEVLASDCDDVPAYDYLFDYSQCSIHKTVAWQHPGTLMAMEPGLLHSGSKCIKKPGDHKWMLVVFTAIKE